MKCEHAQEFFSDYIERSLDKPTGVALEAHLTACAACRRDLEGLRQTWAALDAVPVVEPPADLAWRVMVRLQQEKLEQQQAERRRRSPFLGWLQSLTPGAAFGYATLAALLIVALAFPLSGRLPQIVFDIFGVSRPSPTAIVQPEPASARPVVAHGTLMQFMSHYRDTNTGLEYYRLFVTAPTGSSRITVSVSPAIQFSGQWRRVGTQRRALPPGQPLMIPVPMSVADGPVQAVYVRVERPGAPPVEKLLAVPE